MTSSILVVLAATGAGLWAEELAGGQQNTVITCMERLAKSSLVESQAQAIASQMFQQIGVDLM